MTKKTRDAAQAATTISNGAKDFLSSPIKVNRNGRSMLLKRRWRSCPLPISQVARQVSYCIPAETFLNSRRGRVIGSERCGRDSKEKTDFRPRWGFFYFLLCCDHCCCHLVLGSGGSTGGWGNCRGIDFGWVALVGVFRGCLPLVRIEFGG